MPSVPLGSDVVAIDNSTGTLSVKDFVAVCPNPAPSTSTIKLDVPVAFGVPVMTPEVDSDAQAGKPAGFGVQVYGVVPPVAFNVKL